MQNTSSGLYQQIKRIALVICANIKESEIPTEINTQPFTLGFDI